MAKKKGADAKADKPKSKTKIPKQIAGVKIPKTLRDSGKAAMKLAQNPVARELLSAGLVAAAAAVAANSRARKAAIDGGRDAADAVTGAATTASSSAAMIGAALVDAAGTAAERFFKVKDGKDGRVEPAATAAAKPEAARAASTAQARKAAKSAAASDFPLPTNGKG